MSHEETVGDVARVIEAVGVVILTVGAIGAFALYARDLLSRTADACTTVRRNPGRGIRG